jgi:hypothetical protein
LSDISKVIAQLERQRSSIDTAIAALRGLEGSQQSAASAAPAARKRRPMSAEGRKRIADAVRKRWAEKKAADAKKLKK